MKWAIGDIQGCFYFFLELLEKIKFDPKRDKLYLVGDLVNRGKYSKEVVEYLYKNQDSIEFVLGNHDISLIAAYYGIIKPHKSIIPLLDSPKIDDFIEWLKSKEFIYFDRKDNFLISHAGIAPNFSLDDAIKYSRYLSNKLNSKESRKWLQKLFSFKKDFVSFNKEEFDIYLISAFTRMRFCYKKDILDLKDKKSNPFSKEIKAKGLYPWFECPNREKIDAKIIFGHWAALGYYQKDNIIGIDSGCVWKNELSAINLVTKERVYVSCKR